MDSSIWLGIIALITAIAGAVTSARKSSVETLKESIDVQKDIIETQEKAIANLKRESDEQSLKIIRQAQQLKDLEHELEQTNIARRALELHVYKLERREGRGHG